VFRIVCPGKAASRPPDERIGKTTETMARGLKGRGGTGAAGGVVAIPACVDVSFERGTPIDLPS
jgi:hypothetical protein